MKEPPRGPLDFGDGERPREQASRPLHPDLEPEPRPRAQGPRWAVGVVVIIALALIGINAITSGGRDGVGASGPPVGTQARAFAAPLASGPLDDAVNIATKPDQGDAGRIPACDVHLAGAYNVCDAWKKGPVAVALFITPQDECVEQLHSLQDALARHPRVSGVAVAIRGGRDAAAKVARTLRYPVVWDVDGRLAALYGMAVCPHITYLRRGGAVAGTSLGRMDSQQLDAQLRALEAGARVVVG